jgi:hypothetical protein
MAPHLFGQGAARRRTGGVGGMDDASVAVAAFARQVEAQRRVVPGKWERRARSATRWPLATVLDDEAGRARVAQAGAGREGVIDVGLDAVGIGSSTAAMPPWAQAEAESASVFLVTSATPVGYPASRSASDCPARPLPMMRTSKCWMAA